MADDFAIQRVSSIAGLRNITVSTTRSVNLTSYYGDGNAGGGDFDGLTGAAPSTYVDNGGTTIIPTGGNGSSAWVRRSALFIDPADFGAKFDGLNDDQSAILGCLNEQRRTGKTIVLHGRNRVYGIGSETLWTPASGETVDIRGDGATIKAIGAASDIYRGLYFEFQPNSFEASIYMEGVNFDANGKMNFPLAIWSSEAGNTARGVCELVDVSVKGYVTPVTAWSHGAAVSIQARFAEVKLTRPKIGRIFKRTGNENIDYSCLIVSRTSDAGYSKVVIINNPSLDGVFCEQSSLGGNADSIKLFGGIASPPGSIIGDEQFVVSGGRIEVSVGRGIKVQSHNASISDTVFRCTSGLYTGTGIYTGNAGNRSMAVDWQYGAGDLKNCQLNLEAGTGVEHVFGATTRAYGLPGQLAIDGVSIRQQSGGSNWLDGLLIRAQEGASSKPNSAVMRNIVAPDSTMNRLARYDTSLDCTAAANLGESVWIENCHAATVSSEMVQFTRQEATAKALIISANNSQTGTSVPQITQVNGTTDYTHTILAANRGFS